MKRKYLIVFFAFISINVMSDAIFRDSVLITQPDDTDLYIDYFGDEYFSRYSTLDGIEIIKNSDGIFEYAIDNGDSITTSGIKVSNIEQRTLKEIEFIKHLSEHQNINKRCKIKASRKVQVPSSAVVGQRKLLTILVDFPDKPFTKSVAEFDSLMNQQGYNKYEHTESVRDYYLRESYGQLDIQSTVVGIFRADSVSAFYSRSKGTSKTSMSFDNPVTTDQLDITINDDLDSEIEPQNIILQDKGYTIKIWNMQSGAIILQKVESRNATIDISTLYSGLYIVQLYQNNELIETKKLIIKK